jgi:hypothetical protein
MSEEVKAPTNRKRQPKATVVEEEQYVIEPDDILEANEKMTPSGGKMRRWKASEYLRHHKERGTPYGRKPGQKTKYTIEELRVHINSGWTREMIRDKTGLNDQEITNLVHKLSKFERRKKPIQF